MVITPMRPLAVLVLLALVVGICAAGRSSAPRRVPPNDIKNCNSYPDEDSSSSSSSSSSSEENGNLQNGQQPCPVIDSSQCHSGNLTQCGRCQACLVYLERNEHCNFPWPTNAQCGLLYVCYKRGICDYPV